jgi:adenine-specific DNA-methyltransferase
VRTIPARWLLMSYSTDGNIPVLDVLRTLGARGKLEVFTQAYKRYRVSTPRMSHRPCNVELVAVVDTSAPPMESGGIESIAERIARQATAGAGAPAAEPG